MRKFLISFKLSLSLLKGKSFDNILKYYVILMLSAIALFYTFSIFISIETKSNLPAWWFTFSGALISFGGIFTEYLTRKWSFKKFIVIEFINVVADICLIMLYIIYKQKFILFLLFIPSFFIVINHSVFNCYLDGYIQSNNYSVKKFHSRFGTLSSGVAIVGGLLSTFVCYFFESHLGIAGLVLVLFYFIPLAFFYKEVCAINMR